MNYKECESLWKHKAKGRAYKALNNNNWQKYQLWRNGEDAFDIMVWWPQRSSGENTKRVATIDSTDKWTLYPSVLNNQSFVHWAYKYCRLTMQNQANRRRSHTQWVYAVNGKHPCFDGMQLQARTHLNPDAIEQSVRKVIYEKAKPIILKLRPWEKLGRSYFAIGDVDTIIKQYSETAQGPVSPLEEEPTVDGVIRLTKARVGTPWWFGRYSGLGQQDREWVVKKLRGGLHGSLAAIKEEQYAKVGAFTWVPLDKSA